MDLQEMIDAVKQMEPLEDKVAQLRNEVDTLMISVKSLELQIERLQMSYGTLLTWMVQSANSPIRVSEAERLIKIMQKGLENADTE